MKYLLLENYTFQIGDLNKREEMRLLLQELVSNQDNFIELRNKFALIE
jgi:hypothetical protein